MRSAPQLQAAVTAAAPTTAAAIAPLVASERVRRAMIATLRASTIPYSARGIMRLVLPEASPEVTETRLRRQAKVDARVRPPAWVGKAIAAVQEVMARRTGNLPQLGVTLLSGVLAEALLARAPASVAAMVPANTGTEAVEAAIKIARAATERPRVLYAEHAFHGLTLGALSLNGNAEFRDGFGPLLPSCERVPFGDADALARELEAGEVAAFVVEPLQGKGVNLPPADYLPRAQALCRQAGALFVCDEIQCGIGRTGRFLALEHWRLQPDIICLAKALSGGLCRSVQRWCRVPPSIGSSTAWNARCGTAPRSAATISPPPPRSPPCAC